MASHTRRNLPGSGGFCDFIRQISLLADDSIFRGGLAGGKEKKESKKTYKKAKAHIFSEHSETPFFLEEKYIGNHFMKNGDVCIFIVTYQKKGNKTKRKN